MGQARFRTVTQWLWLLLGLALAGMPPAHAQDAVEPVVQDCIFCPEMIPFGDDGARIGRFPVTREEYEIFAAETGLDSPGCLQGEGINWRNNPDASWDNPGFDQAGNHPAVCVSWNEAVAYADWLTEITGKSYRLPTLEESTIAAAAGATGTYFWGENLDEICSHANVADASYRAAHPETEIETFACEDGFPFTAPVDAFPPNALGVYDAVGNVWQWTNSCLRGDCANAVMRGGGWNVRGDRFFKLAESWGGRIVLKNFVIGFRVLRDPE